VEKVRLRMIGTCPKCGRVLVRPYPADTAVCQCESIVFVPLQPAIILPSSLFKGVSKFAACSKVCAKELAEEMVGKMLEDVAK